MKISLAIVVAVAVVIVTFLLTSGRDGEETPAAAGDAGSSQVVREDSRILGEDAGEVDFVEFLDFECEGCRAAYPFVEQLREEYAGRVRFVARYFPLPGHFNGERAARAVEAAAQQDRFEEMYHRMFETQAEWGEQQTPADEVFFSFAEDLGLDMEQFGADYEDPATAERVAKDVADGTALGVQGTPTFFIDGERVDPRTYDDLINAIDDALAD